MIQRELAYVLRCSFRERERLIDPTGAAHATEVRSLGGCGTVDHPAASGEELGCLPFVVAHQALFLVRCAPLFWKCHYLGRDLFTLFNHDVCLVSVRSKEFVNPAS